MSHDCASEFSLDRLVPLLNYCKNRGYGWFTSARHVQSTLTTANIEGLQAEIKGMVGGLMKRTLWTLALVATFLLVSAASAKADQILDYTLTADGSSTPLATWDMSMMPTPSCPPPGPCSLSGVYFAENVNISLDGAPAIPDTLVFFNSFTGLAMNDINMDIPEFLGDQLYTMDESAPTMSTGSFDAG